MLRLGSGYVSVEAAVCRCSSKLGVLKNFAFRPANLLKRDSNAVVLLRILQTFLRKAFCIEHFWRLLLCLSYSLVQNILRKIMKSSKVRKTLISVFAYFLSASAKNFSRRDWALGCAVMQCPNISLFLKNLSLESFRNSWVNLCKKFLKGPLSGLRQFLTSESPLKIIKKCFLFHVKSSFRSWDIYIFVLIFCLYRKAAWWEG